MKSDELMLHIVIPLDDAVVHLYCTARDLPPSLLEATSSSERLLKESGGNWKAIKGPYHYRIDGPHDPMTGQRHLHVYKKNNELFSLNWDGSGHDNSRGSEIPKKVYDHLKDMHPDLKLPDSRIIESISLGRPLLKFSEFILLRLNDSDAMESLESAVTLLEEFMNRDRGGRRDA
jgi:hypothetical protein